MPFRRRKAGDGQFLRVPSISPHTAFALRRSIRPGVPHDIVTGYVIVDRFDPVALDRQNVLASYRGMEPSTVWKKRRPRSAVRKAACERCDRPHIHPCIREASKSLADVLAKVAFDEWAPLVMTISENPQSRSSKIPTLGLVVLG